ncbi:MAG: hypothetical protein H6943_05020 [Zoogloeaceae bacterium]|nr:hypothetical protein [Zoogloeaceae bacterium]
MGFWRRVWAGLAYGLGGGAGWRIGTAIGDFIVTWVRRALLVVVAGGGFSVMRMCADNPFDRYVDKPAAQQSTVKKFNDRRIK